MFPLSAIKKPSRDSFLCLRRGVSGAERLKHFALNFSLPTQRCFQSLEIVTGSRALFSAYAEVFPPAGGLFCHASSFLCLRRGVSRQPWMGFAVKSFSLPTQRCFSSTAVLRSSIPLFSAYAEVFLHEHHDHHQEHPFLCLRRGVSDTEKTQASGGFFSLPTQRCFLKGILSGFFDTLFSAYAEVFPSVA